MSRYFDDELAHSGVKGMKWRKHKYRLVKDANGKLRYVYDNDNTTTGAKSSKAQMFRQARAEEKDKVVGKMSREYLDLKRSVTGAKPLAETRYKKMGPVKKPSGEGERKVKKVTYTGVPGELKQAYEKLVSTENKSKIERHKRIRQAEANKEQVERRKRIRKSESNKDQIERRKRIRQAEANKEQVERHKRIRQAEANKEQVERRKRIRQAEANKEQIEKRKKDQRIANNYKAKATGRRIAPKKPYQSKAEFDQIHQSRMLRERDKTIKEHGPEHSRALTGLTRYDGRESASQIYDKDYKDRKRTTQRLLEGFDADGITLPIAATSPGEGHKARAAESTARHKAAKKAQEKKYKELEARTEEAKTRAQVERFNDSMERSRRKAIEEQDRLERYAPTSPSERRKNADEMRKAIRDLESVGYYKDGDKVWYYRGPEYYQPGLRSERIVPSKETKKRLRRNKRKKIVADTKRTIDKGKKAVEEFFTPKKKKKR